MFSSRSLASSADGSPPDFALFLAAASSLSKRLLLALPFGLFGGAQLPQLVELLSEGLHLAVLRGALFDLGLFQLLRQLAAAPTRPRRACAGPSSRAGALLGQLGRFGVLLAFQLGQPLDGVALLVFAVLGFLLESLVFALQLREPNLQLHVLSGSGGQGLGPVQLDLVREFLLLGPQLLGDLPPLALGLVLALGDLLFLQGQLGLQLAELGPLVVEAQSDSLRWLVRAVSSSLRLRSRSPMPPVKAGLAAVQFGGQALQLRLAAGRGHLPALQLLFFLSQLALSPLQFAQPAGQVVQDLLLAAVGLLLAAVAVGLAAVELLLAGFERAAAARSRPRPGPAARRAGFAVAPVRGRRTSATASSKASIRPSRSRSFARRSSNCSRARRR